MKNHKKVSDMDDEFDFFGIDKYRLDDEWIKQPEKVFECGIQLADAREKFERKKAQRDIVEAEIDQDIRLHPSKYDLEKVTEGAISKIIILTKEYQKANEDVIRAKHDVDKAQVVMEALDHKKKGLEACVSLHLAGYFAEPKAPEGGREHVDKMKHDVAFKPRKRVNS
jgi:hypothetical protein